MHFLTLFTTYKKPENMINFFKGLFTGIKNSDKLVDFYIPFFLIFTNRPFVILLYEKIPNDIWSCRNWHFNIPSTKRSKKQESVHICTFFTDHCFQKVFSSKWKKWNVRLKNSYLNSKMDLRVGIFVMTSVKLISYDMQTF